ncbi:hypothetical protein [Streptomyces sp. NPDC000880]
MSSVVRLLDAPALEDGSPALEFDVIRVPDPEKTYYPVDDAAAFLLGTELPQLETYEQVTRDEAARCPKCYRKEGRTDFFLWKGQLVMDLACHGFVLIEHGGGA